MSFKGDLTKYRSLENSVFMYSSVSNHADNRVLDCAKEADKVSNDSITLMDGIRGDVMKARFVITMVALLLALLSGCKSERPDPVETNVEASLTRPPANGAAIITHITEENDYRQWPLYPDKGVLYPGKHPHGSLLITYVSPKTLLALESKQGRLPDGTIIVKENYNLQNKLQATTVMYRLDGYNPEDGDWFWLKYAPDQTILEEGKLEGCIKCHQAVKSNDWIFSGKVK